MAALARKHKQKAKRKKIRRPVDANTVLRKPEARLYVYVDDDGAFDPPFDIQERMETIDTMLDNGDVDEEDIGRYEAIQAILATPVALMMDKIAKMLDDIIETSVQNSLDSMDDPEDATTKEESETVYHNQHVKKEEETDPTVPMSIKDLDDWYRSVTGVIQGFYQAGHARKYELMVEFLDAKEKENRDLSDEELLEELEGPEQSD